MATGTKRAAEVADRVGVVFLAAGFGTRLARDMRADPAFAAQASTPKPLLPVGGRVLLDHWLDSLNTIATLSSIVVVTNAAHERRYVSWAASIAGNRAVRVVSDGSATNEGRLGAVADMRVGLDALAAEKNRADVAVVIAGDTLLPGVDMGERLATFAASAAQIGVFAYTLADPADCVRRGMLRVDDGGKVVALVEKPRTVEESPSNLATAPVYILRRAAWGTPGEFLAESVAARAALAQRDAPGFWLSWAIPRRECALLAVESRVDIGGLAHYKDALWRFASTDAPARIAGEPAVGRALARVGLLGNPSDGYGGRCIAFSIESEGCAEVVVTPAERFTVVPNPVHETPDEFESIAECAKNIAVCGIHYGARQLVLAGVCAFVEAWTARGGAGSAAAGPGPAANCRLSYSTTIPTRLGLSGSSAVILATIRGLARFHGTSMEGLDADIRTWPARVLRAETDLLGCTAGLMDRVAQVYGGLVWMDFAESRTGLPAVERLDEARLPEMWLAYRKGGKVGEASSVVHSRLRKRFQTGDEAIVVAMKRLADVADRGRSVLRRAADGGSGSVALLPGLMNENWELRAPLVGSDAAAEENRRLVACARRAGFAASQTGSGGAIVCVPDPLRKLSDDELVGAERVFSQAGYVLRPVVASGPTSWLTNDNDANCGGR
jgi:glucuronokinase